MPKFLNEPPVAPVTELPAEQAEEQAVTEVTKAVVEAETTTTTESIEKGPLNTVASRRSDLCFSKQHPLRWYPNYRVQVSVRAKIEKKWF